MNNFFKRQLTAYAAYHRDERNRVTHMLGIPIIVLAIVLPLSLWQLSLFGIPLNSAIVLAIPAVAAWILLDAGVGLALFIGIIPFLVIAAVIATAASPTVVWLLAGSLSLSVGEVFRKPINTGISCVFWIAAVRFGYELATRKGHRVNGRA